MTKPPRRDWRMLPDLIFSDIMMKIVLENVGSLHRCRQVCKTWNQRILIIIWENPSKREIIKTKIEKTWNSAFVLPCKGVFLPCASKCRCCCEYAVFGPGLAGLQGIYALMTLSFIFSVPRNLCHDHLPNFSSSIPLSIIL